MHRIGHCVSRFLDGSASSSASCRCSALTALLPPVLRSPATVWWPGGLVARRAFRHLQFSGPVEQSSLAYSFTIPQLLRSLPPHSIIPLLNSLQPFL
ncbi:hypothetical protein CEP54_015614 [Fusarium duplospermum]|uniref:Uncharacterized protein n=1 Tax=Fusarium duplospermum TaxID=1325734 RepID=A0A428NMU2_9HYPO|nr:hypothetical protein CEP54_015614 [Fusarium duplospermum]